MRILYYILLAVLLPVLAACNDDAGKDPVQRPASRVFMDYKIWGNETKETVTCLLQFHEDDKNGTSLLLEPPAGVSLDGEALTADSARITGAFYEIQKPLKQFAGRHTIIFTDADGREYKEEFLFQPVALQTPIGNVVRRNNLKLALGGLQPGDKVRVLVSDTSFATDDIHWIEKPENGQLTITREDLQTLSSGPVSLYIFMEEDRPVKNGTPAGGRISITYGLQRDFELVD